MTDSYLLYEDSSSDGKHPYYSQRDIMKDLNLDILFRTMSAEDPLVREKAGKIAMIPLGTPEQIVYRQEVLADFYSHPLLLQQLYDYAVDQYRELEKFKKKREMNLTRSHSRVGEMIETLAYLTNGQQALGEIHKQLAEYEPGLSSRGLLSLHRRLSAGPIAEIKQKLAELQNFVSGGEIRYSFFLGGGLKIEQIQLNDCAREKRKLPRSAQGVLKGLMTNFKKNSMYAGNNAALKEDMNHLTDSTMDYIIKLFRPYLEDMMLFYGHFAEELAFYRGVVNFQKRMRELNIPLCIPVPQKKGHSQIIAKGLYELSMAIYMQNRPVDNDLLLKDNIITLITGANQGGKSTFLRSYGIAQVLMQCGMPVPATQFSAPVYGQIFTHFTRRESEKLDSGRLQEELKRMSNMIDAAVPDSLFLLNESFASTTEKEGSRIADGILRAFYEKGICTFMVTHLFQLASEWYGGKPGGVTFLTAERWEDGTRTFKMVEGKPVATSYGTDLFTLPD